MYYMTRRSDWMHKHKCGVTCLGAAFVQFHPSTKDSASTFHIPDAPESTMWPTDLTGCKKDTFSTTCPGVLFVQSILVSPKHEK
jgi:hypothetical protein